MLVHTVGSEKINLANLHRLTRRVWRATLDVTDDRSEKFSTPQEAMAALQLLSAAAGRRGSRVSLPSRRDPHAFTDPSIPTHIDRRV